MSEKQIPPIETCLSRVHRAEAPPIDEDNVSKAEALFRAGATWKQIAESEDFDFEEAYTARIQALNPSSSVYQFVFNPIYHALRRPIDKARFEHYQRNKRGETTPLGRLYDLFTAPLELIRIGKKSCPPEDSE